MNENDLGRKKAPMAHVVKRVRGHRPVRKVRARPRGKPAGYLQRCETLTYLLQIHNLDLFNSKIGWVRCNIEESVSETTQSLWIRITPVGDRLSTLIKALPGDSTLDLWLKFTTAVQQMRRKSGMFYDYITGSRLGSHDTSRVAGYLARKLPEHRSETIYQLAAIDSKGRQMLDPVCHRQPIGEGDKQRFERVCRASGFRPVSVETLKLLVRD